MGTDIHSVFQKQTATGWEDVESYYEEERHYALFAWLGDVRNGFGFAGVATHTRIEPLSSRRGIPEDFVYDDESHNEKWMGDHSHSWLSGEEILCAEFHTILRTGIISVGSFNSWDGVSCPDGYCGGISGPGVVLAKSPSEINNNTTHVRIEWFEDTKDHFSYFVDEVKRLVGVHGKIRFVFGFDS